MKAAYIYIVTNKQNGTLYIGVTSNLKKRIYEHRNHLVKGFSAKYNLNKLVYYETTTEMYTAITREKQLKKGSRAKKISLIESFNPCWKDLYEDLLN